MNKILLIDDEEAIVRVLAMSLRVDGHEVVTANNGADGLEKFKAESPEIVLTDIRMPGMDGIEVLKKIKEIDHDAQVIIITGHGDLDSAVEALQFGASDFINKPVRDKALSVALDRANKNLETQRLLKEQTFDLENIAMIATEEFRKKSSFQEKLIRSSNDGIVATDEEWDIVVYNPAAERIFGYPRMEKRDTDARDLFPPEIIDALKESKPRRNIREELPWQETTLTSKNGENIPVRFSGTLLFKGEKMMGSVAFFQDLREIKRLERELVQSERLAAIGQTVAGMAHCIKNILHGFKGGSYMVDLGLDKNDTKRLKAGWGMIQRSIGRTSDLVLDLLSYSKEREPEYEICRPNDTAADVCDLLQDNADQHDIEIIKDFSPSVGEAVLDAKSVYRALLNLVSNAMDACLYDEYGEAKKHRVHVKTRREKGDVIRFDVSDNGCGMSETIRKKLFSAFFSTKGPKGTGLGLLVTNKLVEEHKGAIEVKSREGEGTRFTIKLPSREMGSQKE
ncbi:MAG: response regulator [Desulfobacterales bacterium]|nr:response regulator [Desulfobacterales bacterium]